MSCNAKTTALTKNHILLFRKNVVFHHSSNQVIEELFRNCQLLNYSRGQLIESVDQPTRNIHFVLHGAIKKALMTAARREYIFAVTCKNDFDCFFIEWRSRLPSSSNLYSITDDTLVASIPLNIWQEFIQKNACLESKFNDCLFIKYQNIETRLIANLLENKALMRLNRVLNELPLLKSFLNKRELGAYIGVSPETISRILNR